MDAVINPSPIVYSSDQAHYCCRKICSILNIQHTEVGSAAHGQINVDKLVLAIEKHSYRYDQRPIILWLTAGTTVFGAVDNLLEIKRRIEPIITKNHSPLAIHIDGAILGIALPILYPEYKNLFSFTDTLAISGHKLLSTISTSGVALAKGSIVDKAFSRKDVAVPYLYGSHDTTVTGSRWSYPIFELHLSLISLEVDKTADKLRKLINQCLMNARFFVDQLATILNPRDIIYNAGQFNIVFPFPSNSSMAKQLKNKYQLMPVPKERASVSVFPNVDKILILKFIEDFKALLMTQDNIKNSESSLLKARL